MFYAAIRISAQGGANRSFCFAHRLSAIVLCYTS